MTCHLPNRLNRTRKHAASTKAHNSGACSPMLRSVDCKGVRANLVGCVTICGNPVSAHHNRIHLALCHECRRSRIHNEGGGQAVVDQLVRGQPGACTPTTPRTSLGAQPCSAIQQRRICHVAVSNPGKLPAPALMPGQSKLGIIIGACEGRGGQDWVFLGGQQHLGCRAASLCSTHAPGGRLHGATAQRPALSRRPPSPGSRCCSGSACALWRCWTPGLSAQP